MVLNFTIFRSIAPTEQTKTIFIKARLNYLLLFFNWKSATEKEYKKNESFYKDALLQVVLSAGEHRQSGAMKRRGEVYQHNQNPATSKFQTLGTDTKQPTHKNLQEGHHGHGGDRFKPHLERQDSEGAIQVLYPNQDPQN